MRPLRVQVAGGWYHVTSRGLNRQAIFTDDGDREHWLEIVSRMPERFGVRVHGYVLMGNHYHLIVETPRGNLSASIQWLNLSYGVWFNLRHDRLGPVFNRPFKAILVENAGSWALELSRYVHLNPLRVKALGQGKRARRAEAAGVASAPTGDQVAQRLSVLRVYRWSSYRSYAGYGPVPEWLTTATLWRRLARERSGGAHAYREYLEGYVRQGQEERIWERLQAGMVLGSEAFVKRLRGRVAGDRREQPALRQWDTPLPFDAVTAAVATLCGEPWETLRDRHGDPSRDLALVIARRRCGLRLKQLGERVGGVDYLAVSAAIRRMEKRLPSDRRLQTLYDRVLKQLSKV